MMKYILYNRNLHSKNFLQTNSYGYFESKNRFEKLVFNISDMQIFGAFTKLNLSLEYAENIPCIQDNFNHGLIYRFNSEY